METIKMKEKAEGVVIGGEDHKNYIDFEEYLKLKRENEELKKKLSKREQGRYRYFGNDGEQDIYEITSIKDGPITLQTFILFTYGENERFNSTICRAIAEYC